MLLQLLLLLLGLWREHLACAGLLPSLHSTTQQQPQPLLLRCHCSSCCNLYSRDKHTEGSMWAHTATHTERH
jgi:hypothetical protein